jgi:hypothetical protein
MVREASAYTFAIASIARKMSPVTGSVPAKIEIGGFKTYHRLWAERASIQAPEGVWSCGMSNVLKVSHQEAICGLH